jgi:Tol biopolymer transport system component
MKRSFGFIALAAMLFLAAGPADAALRSVRVDFGGEWQDATCTGASGTRIEWRGFEFQILAPATPVAGMYCQAGTPGDFGGLALHPEETEVSALIGPNHDNAAKALRYTYLFDNPSPFVAVHRAQWAFYTFDDDFALVALHGPETNLTFDPLTAATRISRGAVLWQGSGAYSGEYFCFDGGVYLGIWNGSFAAPLSQCAQFILQRPLSIQRVARSTRGAYGNGGSYQPAISADGRYVAFQSYSTNLVPEVTSSVAQVYVLDRRTGALRLASASAGGAPGNAASSDPAISADGRYVAFASKAGNLVGAPGSQLGDVYRKDMTTGAVARVSPVQSGSFGCGYPSLSANARYVAYRCTSADGIVLGSLRFTDLTAGTTRTILPSAIYVSGPRVSANGAIVVFDTENSLVAGDHGFLEVYAWRAADEGVELVSVNGSGVAGNQPSEGGAPSADGCLVAFASLADNLVAGDGNGVSDVFVRNRCAGTTARVSLRDGGQATTGDSTAPSISDSGRYVAFQSNDPVFRAAAGTSGSASVVRDLSAGRTRAVGPIVADGYAFDGFALGPKLAAGGNELVVTAAGGVVSDEVVALWQPFTPARTRVFLDGFE